MTMKLTLALAAAITAAPLLAAPVVVGSNDNANCYPFNCNDSGTSVGQSIHYMQIYSATAFSGPLTFNTISFFAYTGAGAPSVLNGNYSVSFSTTTGSIGDAYPIGPLSNTALFFSGALGGSAASGFTLLGSAYSYNPADGNLVLDIVVSDQDLVTNGDGNGYFQADYTGVVTTRAYDNGFQASGGGGLVTAFGSTVPEPASWALMIAGFGMTGAAVRRRRTAAVAA